MSHYFNPPAELACLSVATLTTQELFKTHKLYGVLIQDHVEECGGPAILCYCRCESCTKKPFVCYVPFADVIIYSPLNVKKEALIHGKAS